jgi:uncharacterized protein (DUF433 family)
VNNFEQPDADVLELEQMIEAGTGLYTLKEAAQYARMHPQTLGRWFKGDSYCKKVFLLEDAKIITFLDFVQLLAVRNIRVHYPEISLQKIRDAIKQASEEYEITHPFARKHTTFIFDKNIWIQPEQDVLHQASGRDHGQKGMTPVIERFYEDVSFDPGTGLAGAYTPFRRVEHKIVMNPKLRFGEPILEGSGCTPFALAEAAKIEGSQEEAAKMYGVTTEEVNFCIDYLDSLEFAA